MSYQAATGDRQTDRPTWGIGAHQTLLPASIPRHRHAGPYAALVLAGRYRERGDAGSWLAEPGVVLVHGCFQAHLDSVARSGAQVLNLPVPFGLPPAFRIADVDAVARLAARDLPAALDLLRPVAALAPSRQDWPEILAEALLADPALAIGRWAAAHGLARETVSRGFDSWFGTSPARFRAENRARQAWQRIVDDPQDSLSAIAYDSGFADQAHCSRAVKQLTGASPRSWRRSHPFKTDHSRSD
jgi:AraC-like DNA-binding protein